MAAFERVLSGIPGMDKALDNIRLGDNVVWQVSDLSEFRIFMEPYVNQAIADGRNIIYMRFAGHEILLQPRDGLKIHEIQLSHRFETFTSDIHNIIESEGKDAFYVFDCLSDLQMAWSTDLLMGNFFQLTCPFLFELDTVAYFPVIRGMHSNQAIAKIRETTQLFMDVYRSENGINGTQFFVHPLKVWNRYTQTMFLPHVYIPGKGDYHPLTDGIETDLYYKRLQDEVISEDTDSDYWDRFFRQARSDYKAGHLDPEVTRRMCRVMMTRDDKMRELVSRYFTPEDYFRVRDRMVGTGIIGGKACGLLLSRKIVEHSLPEYSQYMEPHDSFYIGSDVFYTFLVENGCWTMRLKQHTPEGYFEVAPALQEAFRKGRFPGYIEERFVKLLDYFGKSPIIVRSSSILEDGFGNAFAGKYESVFCVNAGSPEERLDKFEAAIKEVYASMLDKSALEYRLQRGIEKRDEQMAILVQRVSGSYYGKYFMPSAAGVGYSYSAYRFLKDMDPQKGMLRIVAGLGTRAVDRTEGDYSRLSALDNPTLHVNTSVADRHRFSQHYLDMLDTEENILTTHESDEIAGLLPFHVRSKLFEHDTDAESIFRNRGEDRDIMFVTCQGLLRNTVFTNMMKDMLFVLCSAYNQPVDIEFTVNLGKDNVFAVNLLQCRPLQVGTDNHDISFPDVPEKNILIHTVNSSMGQSVEKKIDVAVIVDAHMYYDCPYNEKSTAARIIGRINQECKEKGLSSVLIVPGRIGTSSPELGVPVTFAEINGFSAIFEVSYSENGYMPECSYGSHMFQDLVETNILYGAVFEDARRLAFNPVSCPDTHDISKEMSGIITICRYPAQSLCLRYDMKSEELRLAYRV